MERIKRALELARSQRTQAIDDVLPVAANLDGPAARFFPGRRAEPETAPEPGPQPVPWRTPVHPVDPRALARQRILGARETGEEATPYRLLRTQVLRRLEQLGANTLAIVSPGATEGKTLTAINLAISLSFDLNRTALVADFDLRSPRLASRFGIPVAAGVEECLSQGTAIERALVRPGGYERLTLLPARRAVDCSSELLSSTRTAEVVSELRERYANRVVLFDLPPALDSDDALAFSRHVQAALVVISEGRTRREDVARTLELLQDTPIVGTVLNASRERPRAPA